MVNTDTAFIETGTPVLRVVAVAILLMSVSTVWLNAVTGSGNTVINLSIESFTIIDDVFKKIWPFRHTF